jgi:hypothetical protein
MLYIFCLYKYHLTSFLLLSYILRIVFGICTREIWKKVSSSIRKHNNNNNNNNING